MDFLLVKEWQGYSKLTAIAFLIASTLAPSTSFSANGPGNIGREDYDLDNDGLIEINDLSDLNEIRHSLDGTTLYSNNTGCPADGCNGFELTTDLDFDTNQDGVMDIDDNYWNDNGRAIGEGWLPIGYLSDDGDAPFTATFEGNSNTINNLYINRENMSYIGLFGAISHAQIRNVNLAGSLASVTGEHEVALLAGRVQQNSKIINSHSEGRIFGDLHVGGLVGHLQDSELTGLSFQGSNFGMSFAGGLVGTAANNNKINDSFSKGKIQGEYVLGGLIGSIGNNNEIETSYSTADVTGFTPRGGLGRLGGLLGSADNGNLIKFCFSIGRVHANYTYSYNGIGGFIGELGDDNQVIANFSSSNTTGGGDGSGGLIGLVYTNNIITSNFSSGFVSGNNTLGGLIADVLGSDNTITNSYWATDNSGLLNSDGESETQGYVGLPLAKLQCPLQANTNAENSSCLSEDDRDEGLESGLTLYKDWNHYEFNGTPAWDFGNGEQLPGLNLSGVIYRDSDGDGSLDADDVWPMQKAASLDDDMDGYPDTWHSSCDIECRLESGLVLDHFPNDSSGGKDSDFDGLLDEWPTDCNNDCQASSTLVLDEHLNDFDNDGISDSDDLDDNGDGNVDIDADNDGFIDINNLVDLNAIRYQLDGTGYQVSAEAEIDQSGCPYTSTLGVYKQTCFGYELRADLDFDTNQDGIISEADTHWNANEEGIGEGWLPLGSFRSILEGNNHTIHNLHINREEGQYIGLFSSLYNAQIRNLKLDGPLMKVEGERFVGGLAGRASGDTIISNSLVGGEVRGPYYIGGFIGYMGHQNSQSQIINSRSVGSVIAPFGLAAGGLVGYAYENIEIKSSYNLGYVYAFVASGGLVGQAGQNIQITNSFNGGRVRGYSGLGGLVGKTGNLNKIISSFNSGYLSGDSDIGGLVGVVASNNHIEGSFSTGQLRGDENVGGLLGSIEGSNNIITRSYWATDSSKQLTSAGSSAINHPENQEYFGVPLISLQCPTQENSSTENSFCIPENGVSEGHELIDVLYQDWGKFKLNGQPVWDFGNDQQLPALVINNVTFKDADGDGLLDKDDPYPDDTDNDNSINSIDPFPFIGAANMDTDGDGKPDSWLGDCNSHCQYLTGLELDTDDDNDGIPDELDTDINTDNGLPELTKVPSQSHVPVNSDDGKFVTLTWGSEFFSQFEAYDVTDNYNLRYEASLSGKTITINDESKVELPSGRLQIDWVAIDKTGNRSNSLSQIINVYPKVYFKSPNSITGDNSIAEINVALTGEAPEYPVVIEYKLNKELSDSLIDQRDFLSSFNVTKTHTMSIEAGDNQDSLNTIGDLLIPISGNDISEYDENIVFDLLGVNTGRGKENHYLVDIDKKQHTLMIAYQNIAPEIQLQIQQNGKDVNSINPKAGEVTITAAVTDGNDIDEHTLEWDVESLSLPSPLDRVLIFNPENMAEGNYNIYVTATDSGENNLSTTQEIQLKIATPKPDDDFMGIASLWWLILFLASVTIYRRPTRAN